MKKTKLLHITSSLKIGGAEVLLCDIIEKLGNQEFEHEVIFFHNGPRAQRLKKLGITLHHVRGLVCMYDPIFFARLFRLIKKLKPDLIHSLLWAANVSSRLFAKLLKIPHVCAYHAHIDQDGQLRKKIDMATLRFADHVVAVSQSVANSFLCAVPEKKKKSVMVIENGIDAHAIRERAKTEKVLRKELGFAEDDFVIGAVGRFTHHKNFPLLLESFALVHNLLPHVRLVLLGTGPDEQMLKDVAQKLGVAQYVAFVVGQSAYGYFPLFDCFVQSSNTEGISIALLEAMSFGLPCVVIETGAAHPVIEGGKTGLLVKKSDASLLGQNICKLATDRAFAQKIGAASRQNVEARFSIEGMVGAYKKLFLGLSNRNC